MFCNSESYCVLTKYQILNKKIDIKPLIFDTTDTIDMFNVFKNKIKYLENNKNELNTLQITAWTFVTYAIIVGKKKEVKKLLKNNSKLISAAKTLAIYDNLNLNGQNKYKYVESVYILQLTAFNNELLKLINSDVMTDVNYLINTNSDLLKYLPENIKDNYSDQLARDLI